MINRPLRKNGPRTPGYKASTVLRWPVYDAKLNLKKINLK